MACLFDFNFFCEILRDLFLAASLKIKKGNPRVKLKNKIKKKMNKLLMVRDKQTGLGTKEAIFAFLFKGKVTNLYYRKTFQIPIFIP